LNDKLRRAEDDLLTARKFQRTSSGRSRDSRAWEFWCDSEARNALVEKADQEGSGSAADAIGLMRSNSRGALKANPNRRNIQVLSQAATPVKRTKDGKIISKARSGLARSQSSVGRLQSKQGSTEKGDDVDSDEFERLNTESDKENMEPDLQDSRQRRPLQASQAASRGILKENMQIPSQRSSLGALMARDRRHKGIQGGSAGLDEEVTSFMGQQREDDDSSGRTSVETVSAEDDLECVSGLLKLSQGNWR